MEGNYFKMKCRLCEVNESQYEWNYYIIYIIYQSTSQKFANSLVTAFIILSLVIHKIHFRLIK